MRDPKRIKRILKKLEKVWIKCPDLRLGQSLENIAKSKGVDLFYLEDNSLERILDGIIEEIK